MENKTKKELTDLLKKYPYGHDVFYLKFFLDGEEHELTHYSKHFFVKDTCLEIDMPHIVIPWENVIEIKLYDE